MTSLAILHKEEILNRVSQGERLSSIAISLGISKQAISSQLTNDPDYQAAYQSFHDARLDNAEGLLESATDQIDIARARELWKAYSWRAERLDRRYAAKQETSGQSITIVIAPTDSDGRIIEQE
jgi:hypothetical protein